MPFFNWRTKNSRQPETTRRTAVSTGQISAAAIAGHAEAEPTHTAEIAEKMRSDYQVQLAELVLGANLQSIPVSWADSADSSRTAGDVSEADQSRHAALRVQLLTLFKSTLPSMLQCLGDGRVAYEKVWSYLPVHDLTVIRKLEPLPVEQTRMQLSKDGAFEGIDLSVGEKLTLSPEKCWWLALDPTALQPHGRSRYSGAPYETWRRRQRASRLRDILIEKFALRGGVAHVPPTVEADDGRVIDNFEATARAYAALQSGGLLLLPNSRDSRGEYEFDFSEAPEVLNPGPLDAVIDGMDAEQLRAFGIPEKTVIEGHAVGSHAMVSQQMLVLMAVVEGILSQFINSFQKYVVEPVIAHNFSTQDSPTWQLAFEPVSQRQRTQKAAPMPPTTTAD